MIRSFRKGSRGWIPALTVALACVGAALPCAHGDEPGCVAAVSVMAAPTATAYAQVEPRALVPVNASATGLVIGLRVLPGDEVRAGEVLARLSGPEFAAATTAAEGAVSAAKAGEMGAEQELALRRRQVKEHLATHQQLLDAGAALASAKVALGRAQADADALRAGGKIEAPVDGEVLAVDAADGVRVVSGQVLLALQPAGGVWLRADWYEGTKFPVHRGMKGRFEPSGGGAAIAVAVRAVFGVRSPGGGEALGLEALAGDVGWKSGDTGLLTLVGAPRPMISVPTRALILDRGRWWVMVRKDGKNLAEAVRPAWSKGWNTFLSKGPAAGSQVVVENAYLAYHRGIAARYQPPD